MRKSSRGYVRASARWLPVAVGAVIVTSRMSMRGLTAQRWLIAVAVVLAAAAAAEAQFGGSDAIVDSGPLTQNEISLTLIPGTVAGQPQVLLAAYNDDPYPGATGGLGVSYSTNWGASWTSTQLPFPISGITGGQLVDAFDPTTTADSIGNLFVAHISTDGFIGPLSGASGLYVWKSTDQGLTWPKVVEVSADPGGSGICDASYRFNDRCQITADRFTSSAYKDNLYIAWIKDRGWSNPSCLPPLNQPYGDIYFSRSTDNGTTFSSPLQINDVPGNDLGNMPVPRVAANGTVLVSWLDYNVWTGGTGRILLDKSPDGGVTWGTDQLVATIALPPLSVTTGAGTLDARAKGAPVLATSPTNANELYIVYAADPDGMGADEASIFFIRSVDQGASWSSPKQLNTDTTPNDQILPWIDVKPNGTIDVVWYDRRNDVPAVPSGDQLWDIYMAQSNDGGLTFLPEVRLNDKSFATPSAGTSNPWLGEYLGLAVDSGYGFVAWTSSVVDSLGGDVYFDKVANASVSTSTSTTTTSSSTTTTTLPTPCGATPAAGCKLAAAGKSQVKITAKGGTKDQFKWKFNKGDATVTADFLDPVNSSAATYRVCLYDSSGASQPLMDMDIPPMGTCGVKPCWKDMGSSSAPKGHKYLNKSGTPSGITGTKLKSGGGVAGKSQIQTKGKGSLLPTPTLPLTFPVTVQMIIDDGATTNCWQNTFTGFTKNDATRVKAKGP